MKGNGKQFKVAGKEKEKEKPAAPENRLAVAEKLLAVIEASLNLTIDESTRHSDSIYIMQAAVVNLMAKKMAAVAAAYPDVPLVNAREDFVKLIGDWYLSAFDTYYRKITGKEVKNGEVLSKQADTDGSDGDRPTSSAESQG